MGTHARGNEEERGALDAFIKLTRASNAVTGLLDRVAQEAGLTPSQFGTLEALYHLGPLCPGEIGQKILKSSGNMTTVIDNLERRGLVRREPDPEDRRQTFIHLTSEGQQVIARVFPQHVEVIVQQFSILTPAEQQTLGRLCKILGRQQREEP